MCSTMGAILKQFPTLQALVRLFTCMDTDVFLQVAILVETFVTIATYKWLLPTVDSDVCFQLVLATEFFWTPWTAE
jgi:hypothetical protein